MSETAGIRENLETETNLLAPEQFNVYLRTTLNEGHAGWGMAMKTASAFSCQNVVSLNWTATIPQLVVQWLFLMTHKPLLMSHHLPWSSRCCRCCALCLAIVKNCYFPGESGCV